MNFAVIGAGAIGSVVAAYLSKAGHDVILVGKKDQVEAINAHGLKVKGARGEETFRIKAATQLDHDRDLTIFAVKTQDIEEAYQANADYLEHSTILSTQNGVQADNILSCHFDKDQIISSIVMFGATFIKPGEVTFNFEGDWVVGKPFMPNDPNVHRICGDLARAFKVVPTEGIMGMKYLKLFVNFNNCIPALIGKSMQETFADLDLCRLSIMLLKEGVDIVQKAKIELVSMPSFEKEKILGLSSMPVEQAAVIINKTMTTLSKEPLYGSILQSIMRGRTSEIDFINGEVVHLANSIGSKAPLNAKIVDLVHRVEETGKYFDKEVIKKEFNIVGAAVPSRPL